MATIGNISGSQFIGCPITVPVTSGTITGSPTFRRVRLKVEVKKNSTKVDEFEFATPVSADAQTVQFDVSSALRAVAEQYQYEADPNTISYPTYQFTATAYDDYMIDGVNYDGMNPSEASVSGNLYIGTLTDRERLSGNRPSRYSRKPASGTEVIFIGTTYITPGATTEVVEQTTVQKDPTATKTTVTASTSIAGTYVVAMPQDGYELRFVNSLGIHESLCLQCLRTEETPITSSSYVVAKQETLTEFSRSVTTKQDDREEWKLSSGPLDQAWLRYFIHEVLMAEIAWIKVNGLWLPIEIQSDDAVVGVDRVKADMLEVQFKVKFGINGRPL